jgi:hypothetical protein
MDHHNYSEDDRQLEERLVVALGRERFFRPPGPKAWVGYAAAAAVFFFLGVGTGAYMTTRHAAEQQTVITTQEVLWF